MGIFDIIRSVQGNDGLDDLARRYGLDAGQLQAILNTVIPALAQRMEANTLSRGGVADLLAEIGRPEHARILEQPAVAAQPWAGEAGIRALDLVFGDKAKSRALAARAAANSGVSQDLIQKLLPIIASILMGALAKGSQGGLGDILKRLPGGGMPSGGPEPRGSRGGAPASDDGLGGLGDILKRIPGMPGGDAGREGGSGQGGGLGWPDPVDQRGGPPATGGGAGDTDPEYGSGSPLPLPGSRIPGVNAPSTAPPTGPGPYGDLPDIIRRGGLKIDGDPLSSIVRSVLGSLLGFQSKGVLGWIIQLIVMRWGWGLLKSVLGRVLTGR